MNHICKHVLLAILPQTKGPNCRASDQEIFHHERFPGQINSWHSEKCNIYLRTQQKIKLILQFLALVMSSKYPKTTIYIIQYIHLWSIAPSSSMLLCDFPRCPFSTFSASKVPHNKAIRSLSLAEQAEGRSRRRVHELLICSTFMCFSMTWKTDQHPRL